MARREKTVHISEQSHRYLKECVRMGAIIDRTSLSVQYYTDLAIRLMFRHFVRTIRTTDSAHLLDAQLVQDVEREIESMTS